MNSTVHSTAFWPLLVYAVSAVALAAIMIGLSYVLGERHREQSTDEPYESGVAATGTAQVRFDVRYYLIAMFFVIFDLESIFIFAWSAAVRELGWPGYFEILVFVGVLAAMLIYLWRLGALEWGSLSRKMSKNRKGY